MVWSKNFETEALSFWKFNIQNRTYIQLSNLYDKVIISTCLDCSLDVTLSIFDTF